MEDIHLSLLTVLPGVLLVLVALLLVLMAVKRRRRALASRSHPVAMIDTIDSRAIVEALNAPNSDSGVVVLPVERPDGEDGEETDGSAGLERSSGVMASREQRRIVDTVLSPARRSHGRHSAVLPAPSGVLLLLLVPIAVKRRRRVLEVSPGLGSTPTDSVDDVAVVEDSVGRERDTAVIAAPGSSEARPEHHDGMAAAGDIHTYRRRVNATIQAMTRRIGPGESPELVEARMLAAVDRLDGPVGFARPRLSPSGPHRSLGQLGHTPQTALPAGPAGLPSGELAADRPVGDESREADPPRNSRDAAPPEGLESEGAQPEGFALEDHEVVLPVPPLAPSNNTRRRGLRRRG